MVELPEDKTLHPGTWYLWKTGKKRIFVSCPLCGQIVSIDPEETEVLADGRLAVLLECPSPNCDFMDAVRLLDWAT